MDVRQTVSSAKYLPERLSPEQHDNARIDEIDLTIQPTLLADRQFIVSRPSIPGRPALDAVRDEDHVARQPCSDQQGVQKSAGASDEGAALDVFPRTWRLANDHDPCVGRSFARHGVRSALREPAPDTSPDAFVKNGEGKCA
jgi:hypothetical protein